MAAYTVKDFVNAIRSNDFEAINDIAKKYPVPFAKISAAVAIAPDAMADVAELIGDATTGTKMNNMAKAVWGAEGASGADEAEDSTEDTTEVEKPAPKRRGRPRKAAADTEEAEKPAPKRRGRPAKKQPEPEPVEEAEDEGADEENPYAGMTAPQLYKECKERGIAVKPRQKAQVYVDLLIENDNAGDADDDNDDEDDWDI